MDDRHVASSGGGGGGVAGGSATNARAELAALVERLMGAVCDGFLFDQLADIHRDYIGLQRSISPTRPSASSGPTGHGVQQPMSRSASANTLASTSTGRAGGSSNSQNGGGGEVKVACPSCARVVEVSRFAKHLSNCLGKNRNTMRATRSTRSAALAAAQQSTYSQSAPDSGTHSKEGSSSRDVDGTSLGAMTSAIFVLTDEEDRPDDDTYDPDAAGDGSDDDWERRRSKKRPRKGKRGNSTSSASNPAGGGGSAASKRRKAAAAAAAATTAAQKRQQQLATDFRSLTSFSPTTTTTTTTTVMAPPQQHR